MSCPKGKFGGVHSTKKETSLQCGWKIGGEIMDFNLYVFHGNLLVSRS